MTAKRRYVEVTLKKYKALQELKKGKSTNHVAAKCNLQGRLKKSDPKKVPMFQGMELSSPNIKKKFYIFSIKTLSYVSGNRTF